MRTLLLLALALALAGCGRTRPETLADSDYDRAAMDAAIARARAETDVFLKALAARDGEDFSVKAPITDPHGTEHFWIVDIAYADGEFRGTVGNEPGIVENVKFGQT